MSHRKLAGLAYGLALVLTCASAAEAQCQLIPAVATVAAGNLVAITASGAPGGQAFFFISAGPNRAEGSGLTSLPVWTYTTTHGVGTDTVTASGTYEGHTFTCAPAAITWTPPRCTLDPTGGHGSAGTPYTVTATVVNGDGVPVADTKVAFVVKSGPNTGKNSGLFPPTTDSNGRVSFTYDSQAVTGVDVIEASGFYGSAAYACTSTVEWDAFTCDEGSEVVATLPAIAHVPSIAAKPYRIGYGELPVKFRVAAGPGTLCEAESEIGRLPVSIALGTGRDLYVADSVGRATLAVFEAGGVAEKPACSSSPASGTEVANDCIIDGQPFDPAARYLRWSTEGFEIRPLPYLPFKTPPLPWGLPPTTLWLNLTQRGLDRGNMLAVVAQAEPEVHRELSQRLPLFARWMIIQDPGEVRLFALDGTGRTSGTLPDGRKTSDIPQSFVVDSPTTPGVFVQGMLEGSFLVALKAVQATDYSVAAASLNGSDDSEELVQGALARRETAAYRVTMTVVGGSPTQTIVAARLITGDLNGDQLVNCSDVAVVKRSLGLRSGQPGFNAWADTNADDAIDARDVAAVTKQLPRRTTC